MKVRSVVVPLDGRKHSLAALPVARTFVDIFGASLHVLHVGERIESPRDAVTALGLDHEILHDAVFEQEQGAPAEAIRRYVTAQPDPVVVMCTHTGADKPRGALGSVAEAILRCGLCPLVLVPPERGTRPWTLERILLPHDGTPSTNAAMDPAGDLAEITGAEILVLHVAESGRRRPEEPGTITVPRYLDQPQHEWPQWAAEFIDRMTALGHPPAEVRFRLSMAAGNPGVEIVRAARRDDVSLIVLVWHGRWQGERALTLKCVVHQAERPVLVLCIARDE